MLRYCDLETSGAEMALSHVTTSMWLETPSLHGQWMKVCVEMYERVQDMRSCRWWPGTSFPCGWAVVSLADGWLEECSSPESDPAVPASSHG